MQKLFEGKKNIVIVSAFLLIATAVGLGGYFINKKATSSDAELIESAGISTSEIKNNDVNTFNIGSEKQIFYNSSTDGNYTGSFTINDFQDFSILYELTVDDDDLKDFNWSIKINDTMVGTIVQKANGSEGNTTLGSNKLNGVYLKNFFSYSLSGEDTKLWVSKDDTATIEDGYYRRVFTINPKAIEDLGLSSDINEYTMKITGTDSYTNSELINITLKIDNSSLIDSSTKTTVLKGKNIVINTKESGLDYTISTNTCGATLSSNESNKYTFTTTKEGVLTVVFTNSENIQQGISINVIDPVESYKVYDNGTIILELYPRSNMPSR
jgi:hypothetical protein